MPEILIRNEMFLPQLEGLYIKMPLKEKIFEFPLKSK
jgi:hypothetical protein